MQIHKLFLLKNKFGKNTSLIFTAAYSEDGREIIVVKQPNLVQFYKASFSKPYFSLKTDISNYVAAGVFFFKIYYSY